MSLPSSSPSPTPQKSHFPSLTSSVLNLPKTAVDQEIRERYRALSVVFHPDKQADPARREAATERFLQVQKAYEGACPAFPPHARLLSALL